MPYHYPKQEKDKLINQKLCNGPLTSLVSGCLRALYGNAGLGKGVVMFSQILIVDPSEVAS